MSVSDPALTEQAMSLQACFLAQRWQRIAGRLPSVRHALANPRRREWAMDYTATFCMQASDLRREIATHNAECQRLGMYAAKVDTGELFGF